MSAQPHHTHTAASSALDPMVYDVMRESATWLRGGYQRLKATASSSAERDHWSALDREVVIDLRAIDPYDESLVRAKTAEYTQRRRALPID